MLSWQLLECGKLMVPLTLKIDSNAIWNFLTVTFLLLSLLIVLR